MRPVRREPEPSALRFVPGYLDTLTPRASDWCVAVRDDLVLVAEGRQLPRVGEVPVLDEPRHIGALDNVPVWAGLAPTGGHYLTERSWAEVVTHCGMPLAAVAVRGVYDVLWCARNRYCGGCGAPLAPCPGFPSRCCTRCNILPFVPQQLSPAVLVAVLREDHLLLVRHSSGPAASSWALVSGFVEAGECLEDAVRREVWEELGMNVGDVHYVGSQPWSLDDPGVLLVAFTANWTGGEPLVDSVELSEARWFTRQVLRQLPTASLPSRFSFAKRLIDDFRSGTLTG
jgi:NAD+ diphosphatase